MSSTLPETYTGPGLVDIQVNGYAGFDFNNDPAAWTAAEFSRVVDAMGRRGVTAFFPTIITDDPSRMVARAKRYSELLAENPALEPHMPKLHIEGPFISPVDGPRGAHPKAYATVPAKAPKLLDELVNASSERIGILSLAPEVPGATDVARRATDMGICVAIAHAQPKLEDIDRGVKAGIKMSTHLGNGSHSMLPRLANYLQMQLADDRLWASFIADGHHIPFYTLKNFIRAKGIERTILTTDAMAAAEMGEGKYILGGVEVVVSPSGRVAAPGADNLAGSSLTPDMGVINVTTHCDVTFEDAWRMASTSPVKLLGLPDQPDVTVVVTPKGFQRQA